MREIREIVVHCSDSTWGDLAEVTRWHTGDPNHPDPRQRGNGWDRVGYHAIIGNGHPATSRTYVPDADGAIEYGCPLDTAGIHVKGHNAHSLAVCLIGRPDEHGRLNPTAAQMCALLELLATWCREFGVRPGDVRGHREYPSGSAKSCPGFDVEHVRAYLARRLGAAA